MNYTCNTNTLDHGSTKIRDANMNPYNKSYPSAAALCRITPAMHQQPVIMIHAFFDGFGRDSPKRYLWQMFSALLRQEESNTWSALERSNYCWFYEQLEGLIEANYILYLYKRAAYSIQYHDIAAQ